MSPYGGGLWRTWFDRDLSVAGQVIFQERGDIRHALVDGKRPLLCIPSLAIHLDPERGNKFDFNKETHLLPLLATQAELGLRNVCEAAKVDKAHMKAKTNVKDNQSKTKTK